VAEIDAAPKAAHQADDANAAEQLSDLHILAAISRGELHAEASGVRMSVIAEHLGLVGASAATRVLRPLVDVLIEAGTVKQFRLYGVKVWGLTPNGRRRVTRARRAGRLPALPEAPQHSQWRLARIQAAGEVEPLHEQLGGALEHASSLIAAPRGSSEAWSELGQRLRVLCVRLAVAHYCLHEWPEPDDERPDSEARRRKLDLTVKGL
jgi:hypothetical protein